MHQAHATYPRPPTHAAGSGAFLVVWQTGLQGSSSNLDFTPYPPGSTVNGAACRTRSGSLGSQVSKPLKFPLWPTLLATASASNNIADPGWSASGPNGGYLDGGSLYPGVAYGLPTRGAIAMTIAGGEIFPVFNNQAGKRLCVGVAR